MTSATAAGVAATKRIEQLLRLTFELIEIGSLRKRAGRKSRAVTMSSFRAARCASAGRPVSAHSGRKEFIEAMDCANAFQVDAVLPADTGAP